MQRGRPRATVRCPKWVSKCRKCGLKFTRANHNRRVNPCPNCGQDRTCGGPVTRGFRFCWIHGGSTPSHIRPEELERVSKFPLVRLSERYLSAMGDGRLISNRATMEVVQARLAQLAERIDLNQAPDRLKNLQELWSELRRLEARGKDAEATTVKFAIDEEFERAYHDYAAWQEMYQAIDLHRKLVEGELKVFKEKRAILTAEDARELIGKLLAIITEEVKDQATLRAIQYKFVRLIGDQPGEARHRARPESEAEDVDSE
jgi:hypothetical protein